jgi:hypothetical protein
MGPLRADTLGCKAEQGLHELTPDPIVPRALQLWPGTLLTMPLVAVP